MGNRQRWPNGQEPTTVTSAINASTGSITVLTDANATKANIQRPSPAWRPSAKPGDQTVIFYAGHGGQGPDYYSLLETNPQALTPPCSRRHRGGSTDTLDGVDEYVAAYDSTTTNWTPPGGGASR